MQVALLSQHRVNLHLREGFSVILQPLKSTGQSARKFLCLLLRKTCNILSCHCNQGDEDGGLSRRPLMSWFYVCVSFRIKPLTSGHFKENCVESDDYLATSRISGDASDYHKGQICTSWLVVMSSFKDVLAFS